MLKIISIGYNFNEKKIQEILFDDENTLLDADVLIIDPTCITPILMDDARLHDDGGYRIENYGKSQKIESIIKRRKKEMLQLLTCGKVIISFLPQNNVISMISSTGPTRLFLPTTNYSWADFSDSRPLFRNGTGKSFKIKDEKHPFIPYYRAYKEELEYNVYLDKPAENDKIFLVNNSDNPVAWTTSEASGSIFFIPPPPQDCDKKKLIGILLQCLNRLFNTSVKTPEPEWVKNIHLPGEEVIQEHITEIQNQIDTLIKQKESSEIEKNELIKYKSLLYEKGKRLENAVINSFKLMGFRAENFTKADMEHDVVLTSQEGRAIAEIEGRDNDAIHIDKLDQLSRVIDEDFKENESYAEGILIGNPYRLHPLDQRKEPFTDKVLIGVKRKNFKLLTTVELFGAVVHILENPNDEIYKSKCRKAIFSSSGYEIKF